MFFHPSVCPSDVCVPDLDGLVAQRIPDSDGLMSPLSKKKDWRKRGRAEAKEPSGKRVFPFIQHHVTSAGFLFDLHVDSFCFQVKSGTPVCAPRTVPTVCAAPVTSGLGSASPCCGRDRFARDTAGRGTMAWSCSSAAPAATDSGAVRCESPAPGWLRRRRHSRRWRPRPSLRLPLPRHATPPPTRHSCPRPRSRLRRWQRRDFTSARETKGGRTDGRKDLNTGRKEGETFLSLPMTWRE